jgi:hypothetical protein
MMCFLLILILGFFVEWNYDLLNWAAVKKIKC